MSHLAKGKTRLKDLAAMRSAAQELGGELNEGQKTFIWYSDRNNHCDHAISIKGKKHAYEIGLRQQQDGSFEMVYDTFDNNLERQFGKDMVKLVDSYNLHSVMNDQGAQLQSMGFQEIIDRSADQIVLRYQRI